MTFLHSNGKEVAGNIKELALAALDQTSSDPDCAAKLNILADKISQLQNLIMGVVDDEVLYTVPDMHDDLLAAHWNIACGFYKTAASSLRNALDIGVAGLYFLLASEAGKIDFQDWDIGGIDTPNWGIRKDLFKKNKDISDFNLQNGSDIVVDVHRFFGDLCNYTHSKPFACIGGPPTNSMSLVGGNFPGFEKPVFDTIIDLSQQTIEWLGILWLVGYPNTISFEKSMKETSVKFQMLFSGPLGQKACEFAFDRATVE